MARAAGDCGGDLGEDGGVVSAECLVKELCGCFGFVGHLFPVVGLGGDFGGAVLVGGVLILVFVFIGGVFSGFP